MLFKLLKNNKIDERKQNKKKIEDYYSIKQTNKKTDKSLLFSYKEYQKQEKYFLFMYIFSSIIWNGKKEIFKKHNMFELELSQVKAAAHFVLFWPLQNNSSDHSDEGKRY